MPPEITEKSETTHDELLRLTRENNELLKQNHEYLRKMYRNDMISFTFRILWLAILVGLPFALYYYVLEPYFAFFGANYDTFKAGIQELPGLKGLELFVP